MTSDAGNESRWLLEPPAANEIQLDISIGEGIEITDEVRQALDALVATLGMSDVEGYGRCSPKCTTLSNCGTYSCKPRAGGCTELTVRPCLADMRCIIAPIMQ